MSINIQPIVKAIAGHDGSSLQVHSVFYTIQGEGIFAGCPAVFVRLNGCNLQCPGCDTDYSTSYISHNVRQLAELVYDKFPKEFDSRNFLCVVTGGEPFRQNLTPFVLECFKWGINVQIETNGTLPPSPGLPSNVTVVCSPKTGKVNSSLLPYISAYKYVLDTYSFREEDGLPLKALSHSCSPYVARPHAEFDGPVYVQPMDDPDNKTRTENNQLLCIQICMKFGYILQLQIHKIIGME